MDSFKQDALNNCMTVIVGNMKVLLVMDHLGSILTPEDAKTIRAKATREDQSCELIAILKKKEKQQMPFERLLSALSSDAVGQGWLATEIQTKSRAQNATTSVQQEEEFDVAVEVERIINKYEQLSTEEKNKLKKPLTEVLKNSLKNSRQSISSVVDLEDLVNDHMSSVLPDAAIKKIRNTLKTSNGFYEFCEALTKSSVYALIRFLIGLKGTQQDHLFWLFCTKEFCNNLMSILEKSSKNSNQRIPSHQQNHEEKGAKLERAINALLSDVAKNDDALQNAQKSLKNMYLARFEKVHPFSLPFTFDIENTWVSLALKDDLKNSQATEDHAELLKKAFDKVKMLIIEGNPATGKTSLMRRLAYEWAKGKQELSCFDLIIYAEFRDLREQIFESIADLVIEFNKNYKNFIENEELECLKLHLNNKRYCGKTLLLLDGYDESSLDKQCKELSTYIASSLLQYPLMFHVVLTTRPGYLSKYRGNEGRFVFAEVLGFTTKQQKDKYIHNHFLSSKIDNKHNIAAVHHLLNNNENLNKLAETPLFLTFICLVHERIIDGTLLELYCNIIWWLIDRHQKHNLDRNIPALFGLQNDSGDKFETIQEHYLQFPQLRCLGNMALQNVKRSVFKSSDLQKFNLQPIIEQVGLLRKEKKHDKSFKLTASFFFPHRTVQEFLAALNCICSNDATSEWSSPISQLNTSTVNEFKRFLFRIALSDKMPIQPEKRKYYFESITDIKLNFTYEAFNTTAGFNNALLNWLFSQCTNVKSIKLNGELRSSSQKFNPNDTAIHNGTAVTPEMPNPVLSFRDLFMLHSLTFGDNRSACTFSANSQLNFINCPSLKKLEFNRCELESSTIVGIALLPAVDAVKFWRCTFEDNSQLTITNCPSLKKLQFYRCKMKSNTIVGIETLPAIATVKFDKCKFDLATWQAIADQISNSNVTCLQLIFGKAFNKKFLIHLQQCNNVDKMEITIDENTIYQNDLLSFSNLIKLHSLTFGGIDSHDRYVGCTFSANSQLSFTNCPSLKNLKFRGCEIASSTLVGIATLPAIDTVHFDSCKIDLAIWQSITDQISISSVTCLHLSADFFVQDTYPEYIHHLHKCERIQQIHVNDAHDRNHYIINRNEELVTANLALTAQKLPALTSITISNWDGRTLDGRLRLSERNRERIEKAGRQRDPHFSIKYVDYSDSEQ